MGGTGLGLAVCRNLVALMGGTIALESTPGEGTTIRIQRPFFAGAGLAASRARSRWG